MLLTPEAIAAFLEQVAPAELQLKARAALVGRGTYHLLHCPNCLVHPPLHGRATINVRDILVNLDAEPGAETSPWTPCWIRHYFMDDGRTTLCGLVLEALGLTPDGLAPLIRGRRPE